MVKPLSPRHFGTILIVLPGSEIWTNDTISEQPWNYKIKKHFILLRCSGSHSVIKGPQRVEKYVEGSQDASYLIDLCLRLELLDYILSPHWYPK